MLVGLTEAEVDTDPVALGVRAPCVIPKGSVVGGGVEIVAAATVIFAIERPVLVYTQRQVGSWTGTKSPYTVVVLPTLAEALV